MHSPAGKKWCRPRAGGRGDEVGTGLFSEERFRFTVRLPEILARYCAILPVLALIPGPACARSAGPGPNATASNNPRRLVMPTNRRIATKGWRGSTPRNRQQRRTQGVLSPAPFFIPKGSRLHGSPTL